MKKTLFILSIFFTNLSFAQFNFGITQEFEKTSYYGFYSTVFENNMFLGKNGSDDVKVYTKQNDGTWQYTQTLAPSDKPKGTNKLWNYGFNIALNDSLAIISAQNKSLIESEAGGVYCYKKGKNGLWVEEFIIENPSINSLNHYSYYGGKNLALNKNKFSVSHNNGYPDFVHIYERNSNGTWTIQDTITRAVFGGIDGNKVNFQDSTFTAMFYNYKNQSVKEFRLQKDGSWKDSQTLNPDTTGMDTDFGNNINVRGNQMVVCSYYEPINGKDTVYVYAGKVYLYERINKNWVFKQKLTSPAPNSYANFGKDAIFKGNDTLIIAALGQKNGQSNVKGALFFYKKENGIWTLKQTFYSPNSNGTQIGENLNISGNQIISFGHSSVFVLENLKDCQGVIGGNAKKNSCQICYDGTTGLDSLASEEICKTTAISTNESQNFYTISPNPFSHELNIQTSSLDSKVVLFDSIGNLIESDLKLGINSTNHLKPGIYFITIQDAEKIKSFKLIKQ